jgi:hypothetical protein
MESYVPLGRRERFALTPDKRPLPVSENDRINAFTAAHATKVDRPDFKDLFRDHETSATMAAISTCSGLFSHGVGHDPFLLPDTRRPCVKGFNGRICATLSV